MRRWIFACSLFCVTLTTLEPSAQAQEAERRDRRLPKRLLFAVIGAGVGALTGGSYVAVQGAEQPGNCASSACVLSVTVLTGGLIGYMIGREVDQLHGLRYRGERPLNPSDVSVSLTGEPTVLSARDGLVAIGGTTGIQLFRSGARLQAEEPRARGIRGISAVDIAPGGALTLGAVSGFYVFPPREGRGVLLREGPVTAVAAIEGRAYYASAGRIETVPLAADTTRRWPGIDARSTVRDLDYDSERGILWAATDSNLTSYSAEGDSLGALGQVTIPSGVRRISADRSRVAIAMGENGVRIIDGSNASSPTEAAAWKGARFVYDVALAGQRLFVAAGPEGVFVLDISQAAPSVVGLAREMGFAAAMETEGPHIYILDRRSNVLRRILSDFR